MLKRDFSIFDFIKIVKKYGFDQNDERIFIKDGKVYWTNRRVAIKTGLLNLNLKNGTYDFNLNFLGDSLEYVDDIDRIIDSVEKYEDSFSRDFNLPLHYRKKNRSTGIFLDFFQVDLAKKNIFLPLYFYDLLSDMAKYVDNYIIKTSNDNSPVGLFNYAKDIYILVMPLIIN